MSEFSEMMERIQFNDLIAYLMYGTESGLEHTGTYEERIKGSYDKLFETLENLFPSADRKNDELYGAVLDFSITHNEVYLEMGLVIGFQLYKIFEQGSQNMGLTGLQAIIKKNLYSGNAMEKEMKRDGLLDDFFLNRINHALETTAAIDKSYQEAAKKEDELFNKLNKRKLSRKQKLAVDRVISAANDCGAEYGKMAYRQGFQDAIKLLEELSSLVY